MTEIRSMWTSSLSGTFRLQFLLFYVIFFEISSLVDKKQMIVNDCCSLRQKKSLWRQQEDQFAPKYGLLLFVVVFFTAVSLLPNFTAVYVV